MKQEEVFVPNSIQLEPPPITPSINISTDSLPVATPSLNTTPHNEVAPAPLATDNTPAGFKMEHQFKLNLAPTKPTEDLFEMLNAAENASDSLVNNAINSSSPDSSLGESGATSFEMPEGLSIGLTTESKIENSSGEPLKAPQYPPLQTPAMPAPQVVVPPLIKAPHPVIASASIAPPPPSFTTIQTEELEEELTLGFTKAYQFIIICCGNWPDIKERANCQQLLQPGAHIKAQILQRTHTIQK
jgi:hypothetical protein